MKSRFPRRTAGPARPRTVRQRQPQHEESDLQITIVEWFDRFVAPSGSAFLYAVPNGERRDALTGGILKAQGVRPGVADLVLLCREGLSVYVELKLPKRVTHGVEREKTYLSPNQQAFRDKVKDLGFRYCVVRSLEEFVFLMDELGLPVRARPPGTFGAPLTIPSS